MPDVELKDYFAAKAMQVILSLPSENDVKKMGKDKIMGIIAGGSYDMAEAMMAERERRNGGSTKN